jgi:hypothetical protein
MSQLCEAANVVASYDVLLLHAIETTMVIIERTRKIKVINFEYQDLNFIMIM